MQGAHTETVGAFYDQMAHSYDHWKRKSKYYHEKVEAFFKFNVPSGKKVLEIGCSNGDLLSALKPQLGTGLDLSGNMVCTAREKHPDLNFMQMDVHELQLTEKYDYVILSNVVGSVEDIQGALKELDKVSDDHTRIVITSYNFLWEFVIKSAERLGMKMPQPLQNWISMKDMEDLLHLSDLELVKKGSFLLCPIYIPLISAFLNKIVAKLPLFKHLCLMQYFIARKKVHMVEDYSVSVVVPARNEQDNIEQAVLRIPEVGKGTEIIFVEGGSKDKTQEEIQRVIAKYGQERNIHFYRQEGIGKGDAVRKGFENASGDILMILDADLTVAPEELNKFYEAIKYRKGELVNGSRLIYPMEKEAMRFLNILGNKFFSSCFSWLLDQHIKDTLCGTKVLLRKDYLEIAENRAYFGDFDPFGDFDLILGAARLNKKIIEVPIRYRARTYGTTNISRFSHGWLLLKMTAFAARKLKFI